MIAYHPAHRFCATSASFPLLLSLPLVLLLLVAAHARADVRLPAIFSDNMVLQRDTKVPIWGWADPGERITVTFGKESRVATAGRDGRWELALRNLAAGGPDEMTVAGKNTLRLRNVLVGEVWLCSGQSNMEFRVRSVANAAEEIAQADHPRIRFFNVPRNAADEPQTDVKGGAWQVCSPQTAAECTAVGYFFARDLQRKLDVPIGLINSSVGATPAEAWTSRRALEASRALQPIRDRYAEALRQYPAAKAKYDAETIPQWQEATKQAKAAGKPAPMRPFEPMGPTHLFRPSGLFNGMIAPLIPYAIQGAIWYQGESNAGRADEYRELFPAMIRDWRRHWGEGDFPFLFVQLANFYKAQTDPNEQSGWAELREAQTMTLDTPKTGMAVIIDIGDAADIHPKNKQDVGKRLALAARAIAYGEKIEYSGPMYKSLRVKGDRIVLRFDHVGGGLDTPRKEPLKGFAIAGKDRRFVWAQARIDGDQIEVWSPEVPKPVAVRYGWANNPACNLYNKDGLPASPFRTDDWKVEKPAPAAAPANGKKK